MFIIKEVPLFWNYLIDLDKNELHVVDPDAVLSKHLFINKF